jgi:hypothetical protein
MNLAALIQSQTLATLLQALQPASELVPGKTVEATLVSVDGEGVATAQIGDSRIALVLAGPQARQADLQPGATLVIKLDAPEEPGAPLRATLVETRPAAASAIRAQPQTAPASPASQAVPVGQPQTSPREGSPSPIPSSALQATTVAPARTASALPSAAIDPVAAPTASPRATAGPLLGPALARQDSLAPLFANLRSVAEGSIALVLPKPLLPLIEQVLAQAVPADRRPVTGETLQQAVQRSGLFLEARQEAGQSVPAQSDLKASLTALRQILAPIVERLSPEAQAETTASRQAKPLAEPGAPHPAEDQAATPRTPPPRRDGTLTPQPIAEPSLHAADGPLAVAETLLDQTDAALDRITLSQYASLPPDVARADPSQGPRWLTEVPFAFQQGTAMVPLRVEQEPPRRGPAGVEPALWRLRFALDVEPMGPLQGVVTLQGRSVGVTLWAEREDTSRLLRGATPGLEAALLQADFENGTVDVHTGQPRVIQPTAGQFLDRLS